MKTNYSGRILYVDNSRVIANEVKQSFMKNILHTKTIMILIVLTVCWPWCRTARANQLTDLRMGEHGAFTRIVFEFKSTIRQTNPIKKDGDRFTIVFPKTAAAQESSLQAEIQKNQRVKSLVLNAQGQDLCADITMPSADFTTKLRYLPKPERMILDIYAEPVMPPAKPVTAVSPKTEQAALPVAVTAVKQEKLPQAPQSNDMPIYWSILMLINLVMVVILGLMQYALLKIKQRLSARWKNETPDLSDKGIFVIDAKIQEEIKKYHGLSQPAPTAGT